MKFLTFITIVSSICGILSFALQYLIDSRFWYWTFVVFIFSFASGCAVYYKSKLERIHSIHRKAEAIYNDYNDYNCNIVFVEESMSFLEEIKDNYPEAYKRAKQYFSEIDHSGNTSDRKAIKKMRGIIKGIAMLNNN